ncbi:type II toxin-antitoxin system RelE family toxin [Candidatus Magnetomonas plexicatena]|uniref:type II toxin-antitoxin system RelE family toxin n=1 Tax=Candidatus Magnetomonas plexicatena TaxID=2552947 RepID=UPI0011037AA6|nr:type II toxin-antitoxin system RelE/ParE family toxin [Nitrospirales bacterium LBB_01]
MTDFSITFARSARKELEALDEPLVSKIFHKIEMLSKEPRPRGSVKLKGGKNIWRIRIEDYRVVYSIDDNNSILDIIVIRHRNKVYR